MIKIICVGKLKENYLKDAIDEYKKRLSRFCELNIIELNDEKIPDNSNEKIDKRILIGALIYFGPLYLIKKFLLQNYQFSKRNNYCTPLIS